MGPSGGCFNGLILVPVISPLKHQEDIWFRKILSPLILDSFYLILMLMNHKGTLPIDQLYLLLAHAGEQHLGSHRAGLHQLQDRAIRGREERLENQI